MPSVVSVHITDADADADADAATPFHHQSAFVRFRPYRVEGALSGTNPLARDTIAAAQ